MNNNRGVLIAAAIVLGLTGCAMPQTHVFNAMERYEPQILEADCRGSPIIVSSVDTSKPNSAGGVDAKVEFLALSEVPIKYVYFRLSPYNRVNDPVASIIGGKTTADLQAVGPFYRGHFHDRSFWPTVWYNYSISCAAIDSVMVEFMDGNQRSYRGESLADIFAYGNTNYCGRNHVENSLNDPR